MFHMTRKKLSMFLLGQWPQLMTKDVRKLAILVYSLIAREDNTIHSMNDPTGTRTKKADVFSLRHPLTGVPHLLCLASGY